MLWQCFGAGAACLVGGLQGEWLLRAPWGRWGVVQEHKKDHASTRGLLKVLSRRKSLLEYIKRHDRCTAEEVLGQGVPLVVNAPTPGGRLWGACSAVLFVATQQLGGLRGLWGAGNTA